MHAKILILTLGVYLQCEAVFGQRVWVSPTTTAQEMRNPYTWYRPYYQAAGEAYSKYFQNAREITAQLYQQAYITGAWGNGGGSGGGGNGGNGGGGGSGGGGNVNPTVAPAANQNWG